MNVQKKTGTTKNVKGRPVVDEDKQYSSLNSPNSGIGLFYADSGFFDPVVDGDKQYIYVQ